VDENIKVIREYVWAKYIDYASHEDIDDAESLAALEEYHRAHPVAVDGETYYLGILYFELAFAQSEPDLLYLARAKRILERYQDRSGERDWDAIADRIEEATDTLDEVPEDERMALIDKVDVELDEREQVAGEVEEVEEEGLEVIDGMVFVPAGAFLSGTANQSKDLKAFWIDQYPVTNAEYRQFVEATGYRSPKFWPEGRLRDPDSPVVGVSWYDAFKYAAFAGKSLPTKDQWEKAVRGTKGNPFPWGEDLVAENVTFGQEDGTDAVAANGAHPENVSEFGVCDAVGNVWEWTESPDPNDSEQRVICGGSWCDPEEFVRADQHLAAYPKDKYDNIGFRCVRVAREGE
jgi:formylglycine-generating enzyme required for sulfatase activity